MGSGVKEPAEAWLWYDGDRSPDERRPQRGDLANARRSTELSRMGVPARHVAGPLSEPLLQEDPEGDTGGLLSVERPERLRPERRRNGRLLAGLLREPTRPRLRRPQPGCKARRVELLRRGAHPRSEYDSNFDEKVGDWIQYDASRVVSSREFDSDFDGNADEWGTYEQGELRSYRSYTQFSTLRPGTWRNSFALLVIKRAPRLKACAAISMSSRPMGRPFFSSMALRSP